MTSTGAKSQKRINHVHFGTSVSSVAPTLDESNRSGKSNRSDRRNSRNSRKRIISTIEGNVEIVENELFNILDIISKDINDKIIYTLYKFDRPLTYNELLSFIDEEGLTYDNLRNTYLTQLMNQNQIQKTQPLKTKDIKTKGFVRFELTEEGRKFVENRIIQHKKQQEEKYEKELLRDKETKTLSQLIESFSGFIKDNYIIKLKEAKNKGLGSIEIDFKDIIGFDIDLADSFLDNTDEAFKQANMSLGEVDEEFKKFELRFTNIPKTARLKIGDIRSKDLGKLVVVKGGIRRISDVRPQVTAAKFECPACGNIMNVLQLDSTFKEPSRCSCGRKGKFNLLSKELIDAQGLVIEEDLSDLDSEEQPRRINVFLKGDLTAPIKSRRYPLGASIDVIGIVKEIPIVLRTGVKSTRFDLLIEANNIIVVQEKFSDVTLTKEEEQKVLKLSKDKSIYDKLIGSVAPALYGMIDIKEAILLQLFGGVSKTKGDGTIERGETHILLIGDVGTGKSQLLKRIQRIAPKGRYISCGKGVSGVGMTATTVKDEILKCWSLEAGAIALSNGGICAVDELDKATDEQRDALLEPMEQQTITVSKANIQATLLARTSILGGANPKDYRFDSFKSIPEQINLPLPLINRFDLIFPIKDSPDPKKDEELARMVLVEETTNESESTILSTIELRKYISYARRIKPKFDKEATEEIIKTYRDIRNPKPDYKDGLNQSAKPQPIPINPRQLHAIRRLAESKARARLSKNVTIEDSKRAVEIFTNFLNTMSLDPETGKVDVDRLETGVTSSERNRAKIIRDILLDLERNGKVICQDDVLKEAEIKGTEEKKVMETIKYLISQGEYFETKPNYLMRTT